ncbi:MAG TPA: gliding motility-associated C-terminal domain-containing protein, partial [Saprospiraceae bacterium]|nr:gliding motility-associated C-terminal domain-containing protein [Saprospiraceae bacterium]
DSITCIAQNCVPTTIIISGIDSVCLNSAGLIQLNAEVNDSIGVGTWTGSGIIDSVTGLFDPFIAGPGIHQISFYTIVNSCPYSAPFLITVFDSLHSNFNLPTETCVDFSEVLGYAGNASPSATFNFDFGDATVISGSGNGPYHLSWSTPGLKTISLQVTENGCVSEIYTKKIRVDQKLEPPMINCTGTDSTVLFSFILDPNAFTHDIYPITTQSYQSVNNTIEFFGLTPGEEVIIEFITFSDGPCPNRLDTFSCVARTCPMPVIVLDPVSDICLYPGTNIVNLNVNVTGGTGTGSGDWSGPGVVDIVNGRFDPNVAGAGAHQVNYHFNDDGCDFNNTITIYVYDPPAAFISNTNLMITCTEPLLFLDGSGSSGMPLLYSWSTANGIITGPDNTSTVEVTAQGVYQLLVTNAISGCKDSMSVTVTVDANIPIANAGPDKTITCDSTQFVLGGPSTTGSNVIYQWTTSGGGHIIGPLNGLTIIADKPGDYTIIVRDTTTGCQSVDQVVVGIDTITATINLVPGDTIDCNTSVSTATSALNEPITDYTYSWNTNDGNFYGPTDGPNVDVQQGGTYTLIIHNKRNGCEASANVVIPESDEIIDAVDVTLRNVRCYGEDNGALFINGVSGGIAPFDFTWNVNPGGGDSLTQLSSGNYTLTVSDQNGCSFVEMYTITEPSLITLDIGPNLTVDEMDSVIIDLATNLEPDAIGSIEWSGVDSLQCAGCLSLEFVASISSTIIAIITDTAGCLETDSMNLTVIVSRIIFIPNIFSPNEDEVNDFFTISGKFNLINIAELRIYDRWGNEVFGKTNLTPGVEEQGWDGKFKNEYMQPGVYVFVAKLDFEDVTETISGNLTLIR